MELPVYHVPHIKSLIIQTQRLKGFVPRAGKVIIIAEYFLSAFTSFAERQTLWLTLMTCPRPLVSSSRQSLNRSSARDN